MDWMNGINVKNKLSMEKIKKKTIYGLRVRMSDNDEWSETTWYSTKKSRDRSASINRIIGGIRTHSFQERKPLDEAEELITY